MRDFWFTNVLSVLFEINEYSLEHQLPNFHECWWDHVSRTVAHRTGLNGQKKSGKSCAFKDSREKS